MLRLPEARPRSLAAWSAWFRDAWIRARSGPSTRELAQTGGPAGLGLLPRRLMPDSTERLVCGFCSTGCGLVVHRKAGQAVNLSPDPAYPVNRGSACPKGWEALAPLRASDRGTTPLLRDARGRMIPVTWEEALSVFAERLRGTLAERGADGAAFLSTGQIATEEMLYLGSLWKLGIGARLADSNTRQCMATSHVAYKQAFGFDAPPFSYADFEESDAILLVGANPAIAHPILWERVLRNRRRPEIVVLDPRRTETAEAASRHIALAPKSDLGLLYAVAAEVARRGWLDRAFVEASTRGGGEFLAFVEGFGRRDACREAEISDDDFEALVGLFRPGRRTSIWWTMGVNQSHQAVRTAQACINLCLLTGNIGKPGTGPNSITGQMNAMGSRLFSFTSSLPAGRRWDDPGHRAEIAAFFGVPESRIPSDSGPAYDEILRSASAGRMGFLWVVATNPAHSWIGQRDFLSARDRVFLVVQDMYPTTETAQLADLYLPSAGWGEKDGSAINSERRLGRLRKISPPPGQALPDLDIFRLVARAMQVGGRWDEWTSASDVFEAMKSLSRGRPCDISGIPGIDALDDEGGVQWPVAAGEWPPGRERRLFEDGRFFTEDRRAAFHFDPPRLAPELPDMSFPLRLLTGRGSSSQWHTGTRTSKSAVLRRLHPGDPVVDMNALDARLRGLREGDWAEIVSRRGTARARVVVSSAMLPGQVFVPMHAADANRLTLPVFDPHSRQPSYKDGAVEVRIAKRA